MSEPTEEVCRCGDRRSDHPNDGPCLFNQVDFDVCHANENCLKYRPLKEPEE